MLFSAFSSHYLGLKNNQANDHIYHVQFYANNHSSTQNLSSLNQKIFSVYCAYVIVWKRSVKQQKLPCNNAFHVKTSQSTKNSLNPRKNKSQHKMLYIHFLHESLQLLWQHMQPKATHYCSEYVFWVEKPYSSMTASISPVQAPFWQTAEDWPMAGCFNPLQAFNDSPVIWRPVENICTCILTSYEGEPKRKDYRDYQSQLLLWYSQTSIMWTSWDWMK